MLDKIKSFAESIKTVFIYILMPVAFITGYILYLLSSNKKLKEDLESAKGQEKLNELQGKQEKIDSVANDAVGEYEKLRDAYLSGSPNGLQSSGTSPKGPDSNKGSGAEPNPGDAKG